jgi:large subunit ribosomal protein L18
MDHATKLFKRRQMRVRSKLRKAKVARPRLSIFRSGRHIYAQVIDDAAGRTLAMSSTLDKDLKAGLKSTGSIEASIAVGKAVAERAKSAGVSEVVFDRGGYRYHGRIKALADAAREAGLVF